MFDGETYEPERDEPRLLTQLERVARCLGEGGWWSLWHLRTVSKGSEAGVSARLRDFRKERFGGFVIERKRTEGGGYLYRVAPDQLAAFRERWS